MTDPVLTEVLNELEAREMPLLTWGVTSGAYGEDEILDLLESMKPEDDPEDLLERLLAARLVFERGLAGNQFRTRMAETVRLARHLRQWFHGPRSDWRTAKTLVSDMRFLARPRAVPVRAVDERELVGCLSADLGERWTASHEENLSSLLRGWSVSEFQARATERLLSAAGDRGGTCVTAGTGAGKTLAFYLPALTHVLSVPGPAGTPRVVAIYPRTELLRDQLGTILKLVGDLEERGSGRLRVGVLYASTPHDRDDAQRSRFRGWRSTADGLISPIVGCLAKGCSGEFIWPNGDEEGRLLRCSRCGLGLKSLVFTRQSLASKPPEILFTTTEMVNRLLGTPRMRRLLVGDLSGAPDFVLLDEIHTYSGTHGAQVAHLIRRWRAEMTRPSHVVGLSATLADPAGFFSQLIGADTGNVAVVAPGDAEMRESGREYFMALRGDPASQTSLLSTTIQTAMLMRRMLDRELGVPSGGTFGSRVFAFTDKLDVVNRLHAQLQDAEGWRPGGVDRKPEGSLALLRASGDDNGPRDDAGQLWDAAEELGTLERHIVVDRTTSQDAGVGSSSDIVVATASLEVGFDDPKAGAVLQHKAPRDAAQFLQRQGRAGRDPAMRPWTTVVLSDYGHDRLAFQAYEALFDPKVQPSHLPIKNRVILKMQATWWLVDHLTRVSGGRSLRSVLESLWTRDADRQVRAADAALAEARNLLTEEGLDKMASGLQRSLRISEDEARSVLFDHPRAIATTVVPTIIRRLEAVLGRDKAPGGFRWGDPLVDFVPSALFATLQTPEVRMEFPHAGQVQAKFQVEPIAPSMREFAPGRVSYRFALEGKRERMWVEPPASTEPSLELDLFCSDYLQLACPPGLDKPVVQPRSMQLSRPASLRVPDSSYGRWNWEVFFRVNGIPPELEVPSGTTWTGQVLSVAVMTHRARAPLTVWRVARTVEVERHISTEPPRTRHRVQLAGRDAAIGFAMEVDGVRFDVSLPQQVPVRPGTALDRALRSTYFEHLVRTDPVLTGRVSSPFMRDWIAQLSLCAVVTASAAGSGLVCLSDTDLSAATVEAARAVFGAVGPSDDPAEPNHDPGLVADVEAVLGDAENVAALQRCLASLRSPLPAESLAWMHERYSSTVAAGLIGAMQAVCPDLEIDDLRADCELLSTDDGQPFARIMVSEDQPGGSGAVEAVVDRITEDPRAFWAVVSSVLGPCDGERVDRALRRFLRSRDEGRFAVEVDQVRASSTLAATTKAWASLRERMFSGGIDADQTVVSALATRLLRAGSDMSVERLCRDLLGRWDSLEAALGLEVDLRVFAYIAAQSDEIRRALATVASGTDQNPDWLVGQIVGLLWPRGSRLRAASLASHNPYRAPPSTERLLVEHITRAPAATVWFGAADWRVDLDEQLGRDGAAQIACTDEAEAAEALRDLLTAPTAVGVLEFHPRVVGVERSTAGITLTVDIREVQQ